MKSKICLLFLCFVSLSASAGFVKCYSNGKLIYKASETDVLVGDGFIINKYPKYNDFILADCIVRYSPAKLKKVQQTRRNHRRI